PPRFSRPTIRTPGGDMVVRFAAASLVALALVSQACHSNRADQTPGASTTASAGGTGSTTGAGATAATPSTGGTTMSAEHTGGPSVEPTAAQIALGEKIFHGSAAGGTCAGCHGAKGKGTGVAPNLSDEEWLD